MNLLRPSLVMLLTLSGSIALADDYLGRLSENRYDPDSTSNPYGRYGSQHSADSVNNPYGQYGSRYSSNSANNPYATDAPKLYDSDGNYRGRLSSNRYDPDSVSNPYGRYGSPNNPYGEGLSIYGDDD